MRLLYALTHFTITTTLLLGLASRTQAQSVGIGTATPNPKAALDISASDKGLLIPRMDSATRAQITAPPDGLMVFQTNGRKGFWYAIGGVWVFIPDKTKSGDNLGSHSATQNLNLNGHQLTGGAANGLNVTSAGQVQVRTLGTGGNSQLVRVDSAGRLLTGNLPVGGAPNPVGPANVSVNPIGSAQDLAVRGNTAYVTTYNHELQTIDIQNPAQVTIRATVNLSAAPSSIAVDATNAVIAFMDDRRLQVFNVSNPAAPTLRSTLSLPGRPGDVQVVGSTAYVLDIDRKNLLTVDISNPAAPVILDSIRAGNDVRHVFVQNSVAYVADGGGSQVTMFDVSQPAALVSRGAIPVGLYVYPYSAVAAGSMVYVTYPKGLRIFDVQQPSAPVLVGTMAYSAVSVTHDLMVADGIVYALAYEQDYRLLTIDVTNPAIPVRLGSAAMPGYPSSLGVQNRLAYVATNSADRLAIFGQSALVAPSGLVSQNQDGSLTSVPVSSIHDNLGDHSATQSLALNTSHDLLLRGGGDTNHGLGWYGQDFTSLHDKLWDGADVDGPVLYGHRGGLLGTNQGGSRMSALSWNRSGQIGIGTTNPGATLHVAGTTSSVRFDGLAGTGLRMLTAAPNGTLGTAALPTDAQQLSLSGNTLSLTNGGTVTVPLDNLGNHTATQNLNLNGYQLTGGGASGLSVTNNGKVGIGTANPAGLLQIATTQLTAEAVDQQQVLTSGGSFSSTLTLAWQSFTPAVSGTLTRLEIFMNSPTAPAAAAATLKIYAGEGISGAVLTTQPLSINPTSTYQSVTLLTAVPLVAGQKYTFHVLPTAVNQLWISVFTTNPYAGGRSGLQSNSDLRFRTFVRVEAPYDALTVLPSGEVGIGTSSPLAPLDITGTTRTTRLQVTDGAASGQVLTSDASGNATWQAVPSSADNLGNHMATQPLNLAQQELRLRSATDANHALFHAETWNGTPLDGPVLTGYGGG
jgi:hypothetical protein